MPPPDDHLWTDGLDADVVEAIRVRNDALEEILDHIYEVAPVVEPMFRALFVADTHTLIELRRLEAKVELLVHQVFQNKERAGQ